MKTPKYFEEKMRKAAPHKWGQFNGNIYLSLMPYVLYKLSDGMQIMVEHPGCYTSVTLVNDSFAVEMFNPKAAAFSKIPAGEDDWIFCITDSTIKDIEKTQCASVITNNSDGYIKFDLKAWLHKHVSPEFIVDQDLDNSLHQVKIGAKVFNLRDELYGKFEIAGSYEQPYMVYRTLDDLRTTIFHLAKYFQKVRLPASYDSIYEGIQNGSVDKAAFLQWIQGT